VVTQWPHRPTFQVCATRVCLPEVGVSYLTLEQAFVSAIASLVIRGSAMQQNSRHIRFLETRAMRAFDNAAGVRAQAEAMEPGSLKEYLLRLAADYDRIANRANEQIRREQASSAEDGRRSRLRAIRSSANLES
jgi:hypothetical protein